MKQKFNPNLVPPGVNIYEWVYTHLLTEEERHEIDMMMLEEIRQGIIEGLVRDIENRVIHGNGLET